KYKLVAPMWHVSYSFYTFSPPRSSRSLDVALHGSRTYSLAALHVRFLSSTIILINTKPCTHKLQPGACGHCCSAPSWAAACFSLAATPMLSAVPPPMKPPSRPTARRQMASLATTTLTALSEIADPTVLYLPAVAGASCDSLAG